MQSGITIRKISNHAAFLPDHSKVVVRLHLGLLRPEYSTGETPKQANTFINQFMAAKGDFPKGNFRVLGWIHSSRKQWWSSMVNFILKELKELLVHSGLYSAIRAI